MLCLFIHILSNQESRIGCPFVLAVSVFKTIQKQTWLIPVKIKYSETTIAKNASQDKKSIQNPDYY